MDFLRNELLSSSGGTSSLSLKKTDVVNHQVIVDRIKAILPNAEVLLADEPIEMFYANEPKENWEYEKDYSCVSPPFPLFFLEAKRPTKVSSQVAYMDAGILPARWGVLFEAISNSFGWTQKEIDFVLKTLGLKLAPEHWLYAVNFVFSDDKGKFQTPLQTWFFVMDKEGKPIRNPKILSVPEWVKFPEAFRNLLSSLMTQFCISSFYVLDSINSFTVKVDKKQTSAAILGATGKAQNQLLHYHQLTKY